MAAEIVVPARSLGDFFDCLNKQNTIESLLVHVAVSLNLSFRLSPNIRLPTKHTTSS